MVSVYIERERLFKNDHYGELKYLIEPNNVNDPNLFIGTNCYSYKHSLAVTLLIVHNYYAVTHGCKVFYCNLFMNDIEDEYRNFKLGF